MKEYLRFACAYWHSFCGSGAIPLGAYAYFSWNEKADAVERAKDKADAAFEFITKLGLPYYCFHDVDVVDYSNDVEENDNRLQAMTDYLQEKQKATGRKIVVGYGKLVFKQEIYERSVHQSRFSCFGAWRSAGKAALDATIALGRRKLCFLGWPRGIHEFA
jgi:xylose isomerase